MTITDPDDYGQKKGTAVTTLNFLATRSSSGAVNEIFLIHVGQTLGGSPVAENLVSAGTLTRQQAK